MMNFAVCTLGAAAGCAFSPTEATTSALTVMRLFDERSRRVRSMPP